MLLKALKSVDIAVLEGKRCKDRCLECFLKEDISRMREVFWTKTWTEKRVEWFYDKLSEGRSKNKKTYFPTIGGNDVCSVCFRLLYYINKNFYFKHRKKLSEGFRSAWMKNLRKIGRVRDDAIYFGSTTMYVAMQIKCQILQYDCCLINTEKQWYMTLM